LQLTSILLAASLFPAENKERRVDGHQFQEMPDPFVNGFLRSTFSYFFAKRGDARVLATTQQRLAKSKEHPYFIKSKQEKDVN
jgi:hypothetical protein